MYTKPKRARFEQHEQALKPNEFGMSGYKEYSLPYFGIQSDWDDALRHKNGAAWVSVREPGKDQSVHGELKCVSEEPLVIQTDEPFSVVKTKSSRYTLSIQDSVSKSECNYIAPVSTFSSIHSKSISCMDVTEGGIGVSAEGTLLKIWNTSDGSVRRTFDEHVADIYTAKFFPSGIVVLSGGADMQLKIWSAETGECPQVLKGHKGPVLDTCIIDRGRNVISISRDGSAKLWDCGKGQCLATVVEGVEGLCCCTLLVPNSFDFKQSQPFPSNDREVGTSGKLLIVGGSNARIEGHCISSRSQVFKIPLPAEPNAVLATGQNTFVVGCHTGHILTFDVRKIQQGKQFKSATPTPILDIVGHPRSPASAVSKHIGDESGRYFWVAKNDGTCALVNPNIFEETDTSTCCSKYAQLTGSNFDPVYKIRHDGNYIFTACRDGVVRKYSINIITDALQQ